MKIGGRQSRAMLMAAGLGAVLSTGAAFGPPTTTRTLRQKHHHTPVSSMARFSTTTEMTDTDCGCATVETSFSGKLSDAAKAMNHREAIAKHSVVSVRGDPVHMDELVGEPSEGRTSIVVFLRSLG